MVGSTTGWLLAAAFFALAFTQFGWQGAVLAGTVTAFWMLLQFSRAMRLLRQASQRPKGHVESAAMLAGKLCKGMTLAKVLPLTKSLGLKCEAGPGEERWRWADAGGDALTLRFVAGHLADWTPERVAAEPVPPAE